MHGALIVHTTLATLAYTNETRGKMYGELERTVVYGHIGVKIANGREEDAISAKLFPRYMSE